MTPNLAPAPDQERRSPVRRAVVAVAVGAAIIAVVPLASVSTASTATTSTTASRAVAGIPASTVAAGTDLSRTGVRAARDTQVAGTTAARSRVGKAPGGARILRAAEVACGLVGRLRLCSHGDDRTLGSSREAAGGPSNQQLSTASTRIGCYGDGRTGSRVQAVYARPVGAANRLASYQASFRGWAGALEKAVNDSAHQTGGARHIRFATAASGSSCVLDVRSVSLPANAFSSFASTVSALQQQDLDAPNVKYLVWSEGSGFCGMASTYEDSKPGQDNLNNGLYPTYARVDRKCWGYAETHELTHMLGAVQKGAPNATAGLHCRDGSDVMCYADGTAGSRQVSVCPAAQARLLDCRHDDYFSTAPRAGSWLATRWNTANSSFLAPGWTEPAAKPAASPPATEPSQPAQPAQQPAGSAPSPSPSPTPLLPPLP